MSGYSGTSVDLFPILSVDEIYNILNKQLNYKMITIERLKQINYTRSKDNVYLIEFFKNFIFDYQLSGIKDLDPVEPAQLNSMSANADSFLTNIKLLQFIQQFLPSLGINDFKLTDLYNCDLEGNSSKRLIRVLSCLINFIRFSQERLKAVSHLIDQIDIETKLDFLQAKLARLESDDKSFLLNKLEQLELNTIKKNKEIEDINKQRLTMEIMNIKKDIALKNDDLETKSKETDEYNQLIKFFDDTIINNLLSNDISKNLITYKNFLNQRTQDLKTIKELENFVAANATLIKDLEKETSNENATSSNTKIHRKDDGTEKIEEALKELKLIHEFLSYEKDVPQILLRKVDTLQIGNNSTLSEIIPHWKNIIVKKKNILHLSKINILNMLNNEIEKSTTAYYKYKEDVILEYDQMNEDMNNYVQNIIEYI